MDTPPRVTSEEEGSGMFPASITTTSDKDEAIAKLQMKLELAEARAEIAELKAAAINSAAPDLGNRSDSQRMDQHQQAPARGGASQYHEAKTIYAYDYGTLQSPKTSKWPYSSKEDPNPVSIAKARKLLADGYVEVPCKIEGTNGHGHAWMIEGPEVWLLRDGVELVKPPQEPNTVGGLKQPSSLDDPNWDQYMRATRDFDHYRKLRLEGVQKLVEWFGEGRFVSLEVDGTLPRTITPRKMLEHLDKYFATPRHCRNRGKAVWASIDKPYVLSQDFGAYIKRLKDARRDSVLLQCTIPYAILVNRALEHLGTALGPKYDSLEKKWDAKHDELQPGRRGKGTEGEPTKRVWEAFEDFWQEAINTIKALAEPKQYRGHQAITDASASLADSYYVPPSNGPDDMSSMTDYTAQGQPASAGTPRAYTAGTPNGQGPPPGSSQGTVATGSTPNRRGPRYIRYCYKCGVNYSHPTFTCPQMGEADRAKYSSFTILDLSNYMKAVEDNKVPEPNFLGSKRYYERWGHFKNDYQE